jgi:hypothetical protein
VETPAHRGADNRLQTHGEERKVVFTIRDRSFLENTLEDLERAAAALPLSIPARDLAKLHHAISMLRYFLANKTRLPNG